MTRLTAKIQVMGKTELFLVRTVLRPNTSLMETGETNALQTRAGLDLWALEDAEQCHPNKTGRNERRFRVGQGQN